MSNSPKRTNAGKPWSRGPADPARKWPIGVYLQSAFRYTFCLPCRLSSGLSRDHFVLGSARKARAVLSPFWRSALGKKLYVGNLSYSVSSSDLEKLFGTYGTVESAQVIADRESGRSKGFGFVEMSNDEEAQKAIRELNGKDQDGRPLTVNEARPREERGGGGGGRGGYGGGGGRGGRGGGGGGRY
jgi:hypothetical protein